MKVELRVGAMSVTCETDHKPDPSGKCSENDAARQALFERLLNVAIAQMNQWLYNNHEPDVAVKPPADYVRTLEKALEPVLAVEGAIEQAKHTDRKITCREDERLFQCLDAVAEAQKIMQPVIAIEQAAAEVRTKHLLNFSGYIDGHKIVEIEPLDKEHCAVKTIGWGER